MKQVHFVAQFKGGVGKSLIASMLAQYFREYSKEYSKKQVFCFDTDPNNQTFSRYKQLNVEVINILDEDNNINRREFDTLVEKLLGNGDNIAVIDNGSASCNPLMSYAIENDMISLLGSNGVEVFFHIPLYGGDALIDTLNGLNAIITQLPVPNVVVWLNHNQNKISLGKDKTFTDLEIYKKNADRILGVVELKQRNAETFGVDIKEMTQRHLTVAEVKTANGEKNKDKIWKITEIQRINLFYKDICEQLDSVFAAADDKAKETA